MKQEQTMVYASDGYRGFEEYLKEREIKKILLVCGNSIRYMTGLTDHLSYLEEKGIQTVRFSDYEPNPRYESVVKGVEAFKREGCDAVMAAGGGSAMDVAKCIKLYGRMEEGTDYAKQELGDNDIPLMVMPTTAGTGSEATRFAVIYINGEKASITHDSAVPSLVIMDSSVIGTLPEYQKKSTMLDTLSHAIESWWSVASTDESVDYSKKALTLLLDNLDGYLANDPDANERMLEASNFAGKAINITTTTAGHGMCYKLTSLFSLAHGHAAMLVNKTLYPWMLDNTSKVSDPRGEEHLKKTLSEIGSFLGAESDEEKHHVLGDIFSRLEMEVPSAGEEEFEILRTSVNLERLKNNPVSMTTDDIDALYRKMLKER